MPHNAARLSYEKADDHGDLELSGTQSRREPPPHYAGTWGQFGISA
jgi:hypothetical protein